MGLFSSSKKTKVHTSVVRVLEDKATPNTTTDSVLQAIFRGDSIADTLLEETLNGPVLNVERMYRKAANGDYIFGLPNSLAVNKNEGTAVIQSLMESQAGEPVTLQYMEFAPLNPIHVGWETITKDYGYNPTTNELTVLSTQEGETVYLEDMVAVYSLEVEDDAEPGTLQNWSDNPRNGQSPERLGQPPVEIYRTDTDFTLDATSPLKVVVKYVWQTPDKVLQRGQFDVLLDSYEEDREFFQVKYLTESGTTAFWTYMDGAGTYPTVDAIHAVTYENPGTYFPFVLFRHHRTNRTAEALRDTEEFKSTESLLKTIGMDFASIGESIHENPDIADVEQAVMMMAVPANAESQPELRYLFDFFAGLYQQTPDPGLTVTSAGKIPRTENAIVWRDADYKMTLSYGNIVRRLRAGTVAGIDKYARAAHSYTLTQTLEEKVQQPGGGYAMEERTYTQTVYEKIYRHQVNASLYEELRVTNPTMRYDIWENYSYLGGSNSDQLIIPVDRNISQNYSLPDREMLYFRSMNYVFNSRITEKVEWYESGLFKAVLIIAAIVITFITGGFTSPALAAAVSAGLYGLAAAMIVVMVIGIAIKTYVFRLIIKELGVEAGFILAITAAAIGAGLGLSGADIGFLPSAADMLTISTNLMDAVTDQTQSLLAQYNNETRSFDLLKDEKTEELEKAMALLDNGLSIDPFEFIGKEPMAIIGESPDDFYNRTVHSGNIGTVLYKSVESYVDISLTLPDTNSTVGDTIYG